MRWLGPIQLASCHTALTVALALVQLVYAAEPALATQHLVRPGDDWQSLGKRARPGDEIILLPGRHRPASFESLRGEPDKPITIRSINPQNLATIVGDREGLRVKQAANLRVQDLAISGGSIAGIALSGAETAKAAAEGRSPAGITVSNVNVSRIGPGGQRHGMSFAHLDDVRIIECSVEGWGGSAVELVDCQDVLISRCRFTGLADHSQLNGIRARAGCDRVRIDHCRLEEVSERSVCIGGASDLDEFRRPPTEPTRPGSLAEAARVQVEHCVIRGSLCPVALAHADDCVIRNNTIVRPRQCVLALIVERDDPRYTTGKRNLFGWNVVLWEPGDLRAFAEVNPRTELKNFVLEENLWWSTEPADRRQRLGVIPGDDQKAQTFDIDPDLDEQFRCRNPAAAGYGAT